MVRAQEVEQRVDGREERGDRTARALFKAARAAFASRGYAGASVRDIAREAEANPALIRYHFGSKEGLYKSVIEDMMLAFRDRLLAAINTDGTPIERLERLIEAQLDHLAEDPDFSRLLQRSLLDGDERAPLLASETLRPMLEGLRPYMASVGETSLGRLNDILMSFFGVVLGPLLQAPMLNALFQEDITSAELLEARKRHLKALLGAAVRFMTQPED